MGKHPPVRPGKDSRPQPADNSVTPNMRYDITPVDAKLAEITRSWGLDPDMGIGQTADGKLQWQNGVDESNGVPYPGGAQTAEPYIPKVRKLSDGLEGHPDYPSARRK